jgi:hypothetical protein
MDSLDFTMMENQLSHSKVKIEFIKVDGTYRVMICTKSPALIGAANMPTGSTGIQVNESILKVFDLEKQAWRSMRKDSIRQWQLES